MILDIAHSFVNIFAGGRSDIKVYLLILYSIIIFICYFLFKNKIIIKLSWRWFGITLLITYFYGLILHIFYILSNNLSLTDFVITGNNGEISSSVIWHTHIAKGFIGQIFSFFSKTNLQTMDAGGAYINIIPSPLLLLGSTLIITITIQAVFYFITSFRIFLKDKNARQKIFLFFSYILITFSLIKTSIDGGIFNPSFIISIIFIVLFILKERNLKFINYYYEIYIIGIILILIALYLDSLPYGDGLFISSIATLLLLYAILLYGSEPKIRLQFFIPLVILFLSGWWLTSTRDRGIYDYSMITLNKEQKINIYNEEKREIEMLQITRNQSIAELSSQLNKNITYSPINIPGITCMSKSLNEKYSIKIVTAKPIYRDTFTKNKYLEIRNKDSVAIKDRWETILDIYTDPCLPEPLSVINGELLKNNINTYVLVNPTHYDTFNN